MNARWIIRAIALFAIFLWGMDAVRAQGRFGFGVVVGEPTGIAWKYRIDETNAIAGVLGALPGDHVQVNVDFLWHTYFQDNANFSLHYGPGIVVGSGHRRVFHFSDGHVATVDDGTMLGLRTAVGLGYAIARSPVELFFEVAPAFIVTSPAVIVVNFGLGVRVHP